MFPHERSLVKNLAGKSFALIGVNSDDSVAIPQRLAKEGTVTWRSFQNGPQGKAISDSFNVKGWPTIFLIDAKGVVRTSTPGRGKKLNESIAELLEEIGEEFPHEAIDADTKKEEEKTASAATGGGTGGDGLRGGMSREQRMKESLERRKKAKWRQDRPDDDEGDSGE